MTVHAGLVDDTRGSYTRNERRTKESTVFIPEFNDCVRALPIHVENIGIGGPQSETSISFGSE